MEIIKLFVFILASYIMKFFNIYQLIIYFFLLSISLQYLLINKPDLLDSLVYNSNKIFNQIENKIHLTDQTSQKPYEYSKLFLQCFDSIKKYMVIINSYYVKGRDTIVYFIGRNIMVVFLPKEYSTFIMDENIHNLIFANNTITQHEFNNSNPKLINNTVKHEKVFKDEVEMHKFLDDLKSN